MTYTGLFEASAALAVLDIMADRSKADLMPSVQTAWDAAWIACMSSSARWAGEAEWHFSDVMTELGWSIQSGLTPARAQGE